VAAGSLLTTASGAAKQSRNFDPVSFVVRRGTDYFRAAAVRPESGID
jgi:hypothetical protein